jgi:type II pantothenate kinase
MQVVQEIDQQPTARDSLAAALKGVFAGNIFDLGAAATAEAFDQKGVIFSEVLEKLLPRPWVSA